MALFLGVDTSNYTTSVAVYDGEKDLVRDYKTPLFVKKGEIGLRQSDAVFRHVKNLPGLIRQAGADFDFKRLSGVAASDRPKNAPFSYMPCFLAGLLAGECVSSALSLPLFRFSHQEGHLMAGLWREHRELLKTPFAALHFSGGTADVLFVEPQKGGLSVRELGKSRDITAGQLIDRVGVSLGFLFPAGEMVDRAALLGGTPKTLKTCADGYEFNLSGLENICNAMKGAGKSDGEICACLMLAVCRTIEKIAGSIRADYPGVKILFVGGVMSSVYIRDYFQGSKDILFGGKEHCTDSAAGTALLCSHFGKRGK